MGDYPKLGSPQLKDFAELYYWQKFRTQDQCEQAQKEVPGALKVFSVDLTGCCQMQKLKDFEHFSINMSSEAEVTQRSPNGFIAVLDHIMFSKI